MCARVCPHLYGRGSRSVFRVFVFLAAMDVGEGPSHLPSAPLSTHEETIQVGHTVLLKIPSGDIRTIKVEPNSCADPSGLVVLV